METFDLDLDLGLLGPDPWAGVAAQPVPLAVAAPERHVLAAGPADVPLLLRPFVWLLALALLPLRAAGRAGGRFLEAYERGADAVGRAAVRAARATWQAALRVLGPLGRLVRRLLTPVWRLLVRLWDRLGLWLLLRLIRPVGRLYRWVLARLQPVVIRVRAWVQAALEWVEPATDAVLRVLSAVERATDRLGVRLRRAWTPVSRALAVLSRRRDRREDRRDD